MSLVLWAPRKEHSLLVDQPYSILDLWPNDFSFSLPSHAQEETALSSPLDKHSIPNREPKKWLASKLRTQCKQSIIFQTEPRVFMYFYFFKKNAHNIWKSSKQNETYIFSKIVKLQ